MYEKIVRYLMFPLLEVRGNYLTHLSEMGKLQWEKPAVIEQRLLKKIRHIVQHAYNSVPYYRQKLRELGIVPDEIRGLKDFERLPTLDRKQLAENFHDQGISCSVPSWRRRLVRTSGASGETAMLYGDRGASGLALAIRSLFGTWTGVGPERSQVIIRTQTHLDERIFFNRYEISTLSFSERSLPRIVRVIQTRKPAVLEGYPSYLARLADFESAASTRHFSPSAIVSFGETLLESYRNSIAHAFDCPIFDMYGAAEVGPIAQECNVHEGLHVNTEGVYIEIVKDGQGASEGEEGGVIATSLTNEVMPVIRYELGDLAVKGSTCSCGRGFPVIQKLSGRVSESVRTSSGETISLVSLYVTLNVFAQYLRWVGFEQPRDGFINIKIVPSAAYSDQIGDEIVSHFQRRVPRLKCSLKVEQTIPELTGRKTRLVETAC